jgi:phospholipase C
MAKGITRRDAIKNMGVMAGAAMIGPKLAGCGDDGGASPDARSGQPDARGPGAITNIVVVMMENRSYDHYLGARKLLEQKGGDGLVATMSNLDMSGAERAIYLETVNCVADPPHEWDSSRAQFDGGLNDGFMTQYQIARGTDIDPHVMAYFGRAELPVTWALADAYTSCDHWFASVMGPTYPNRFYLHTGQSNGQMDNAFPSVAWPTIYDRLAAAGVPFTYYYSDLPFLALFPDADPTKWKSIGDFYVDAHAGTLPPVVVADPAFGTFGNDDHPPHHPLLGQQFIASIYNALATSPQWESTLLVVTYDEHGGFFDHVAPPKAADERTAQGFDQLGFRVPAMVIGPYVKQGQVSSTIYDHTSVLKHIENMFHLAPLTMRDAAANDLSDMIDQARLAAGQASAPITLPVVDVDPGTLDQACSGKPTDLELAFDRGLLPPEFDRRRQSRDTLHFIAEYLAKHDVHGRR